MTFYNGKEPLYLETDASGVGLGAGLLHYKYSLQSPQDEAPDNAALCLVVFASKSLTRTETT